MAMFRIIFASDFHGSDAVFRKFISAGLTYRANALIVGGDVTGKAIVPIIHKGGRWEGYLFGHKEEPETQEELERFKQNIAKVGFYPLVLEPDEAEELENDPEKMDAIFRQMMRERLEAWMALAEEHLKEKGVQLYFMPGNDDDYSVDEVIAQSSFVINPDNRKVWLNEMHELIGLSYSNITPWHCHRDVEEDVIKAKLEELVALLERPEMAVFNIHIPPYDSGIDICPELDEEMRIKHAGGQVLMKPVGSHAVREIIERVQPLLSLHGHIHEAPGFRRIGRTLCVNPGSEYAEGIMRAALINLEKGKIKGYMPISA